VTQSKPVTQTLGLVTRVNYQVRLKNSAADGTQNNALKSLWAHLFYISNAFLKKNIIIIVFFFVLN
jgi:hypothetical protein